MKTCTIDTYIPWGCPALAGTTDVRYRGMLLMRFDNVRCPAGDHEAKAKAYAIGQGFTHAKCASGTVRKLGA